MKPSGNPFSLASLVPTFAKAELIRKDNAGNQPDYTAVISDRKGKPADQDLYNQVVADARKKFDVYPSAVANGWVVQEYKRRGGKYRVVKGDSPGHPFRGNQYAQAAGDHAYTCHALQERYENMTSPENLHSDGMASRATVAARMKEAGKIQQAADAHSYAAEANLKASQNPTAENKAAAAAATKLANSYAPTQPGFQQQADDHRAQAEALTQKAADLASKGDYQAAADTKAVADLHTAAANAKDQLTDLHQITDPYDMDVMSAANAGAKANWATNRLK